MNEDTIDKLNDLAARIDANKPQVIKPMLAATAALTDIKYPIYASPKLDGVRGLVIDGVLHSRSLKHFPNQHVHNRFSLDKLDGLDGELILGSPTAKDVYRVTNGGCARKTGTPDVKFYVFDDFISPVVGGFKGRIKKLQDVEDEHVMVLPQHLITNEKELIKYEQDSLDLGYEGLILRTPNGKYKYGRSTIREQGMLKLKRFTDSEFQLTGVEEEMHNGNAATTNELGRTARSSHKAGLTGKDRAGALCGFDLVDKVPVRIGTGLNDSDREYFWRNRSKLIKAGFVGKYKHFEVGAKDGKRFPVYLGPREDWDMS